MKPTLRVTNWSSWRKLHGAGRKWTIMARPRHWEHGEGNVIALVPTTELMNAARHGGVSFEDYRRLYTGQVKQAMSALRPGKLLAFDATLVGHYLRDGDTLCCACSRAAAAKGECHRVWAAEALVNAGWRVILDGKELEL